MKITNHFHSTSTNQCYQPRNEHSVFWIGRTERSGLGNRFCAKRHKKMTKTPPNFLSTGAILRVCYFTPTLRKRSESQLLKHRLGVQQTYKWESTNLFYCPWSWERASFYSNRPHDYHKLAFVTYTSFNVPVSFNIPIWNHHVEWI